MRTASWTELVRRIWTGDWEVKTEIRANGTARVQTRSGRLFLLRVIPTPAYDIEGMR